MFSVCRRASERLGRAREVLLALQGDAPVVVLAGSAEAAASLVRGLQRSTFGWQRLMFSRFAALSAEPLLLEQGLTVASKLSLDAVWTRVVFELRGELKLGRFLPIDDTPGLARALHRSVGELRLAGASPQSVEVDLRAAWTAWEGLMAGLRLADRAMVLELGAAALQARPAGSGPAVMVVDVALEHPLELRFAQAVKRFAGSLSVVAPEGDSRSVEAWASVLGERPEVVAASGASDLARLQRALFTRVSEADARSETPQVDGGGSERFLDQRASASAASSSRQVAPGGLSAASRDEPRPADEAQLAPHTAPTFRGEAARGDGAVGPRHKLPSEKDPQRAPAKPLPSLGQAHSPTSAKAPWAAGSSSTLEFDAEHSPFENAGHQAEPVSVTVELLSAPGESRECVELARRILERARAGVAFERMAVLLRSPQSYRAPLEEALRRAGVPAHFAAGTRRPDVAGRALLSLLACAHEGLSARRFAEYLSLAQVPKDEAGAPPTAWPAPERFVAPDDEDTGLVEGNSPDELDPTLATDQEDEANDDPEKPVVAGSLRTPWRWERLLVDAAVIGGTARWRRRLTGLRHARQRELKSPDLSDGRRDMLGRELSDLTALETFALPLLDILAALPAAASWSRWLDALSSLATRALRNPQRVLGVLQELSPLADVGPVSLAEVRATLTPRLLELTDRDDKNATGQVYVAPVDAARGLSFEVVFVPGLAERLFPQKVREDPLLPDLARIALDEGLELNERRVERERLALSLAVGAASSAVVLSWPRIEAEHARPRVPSFYVLEVLQAVHGTLPSFEAAQRSAELAGGARLGWPAPGDPRQAIDETEYDLSVLDGVLRGRETHEGRAHYLLQRNPTLARALRSRYLRWSTTRFTKADGLVLNGPLEALALAPHSLTARAFAPTALEKFAACPYRFVLSVIHRLKPMRMPEAIEAIGPLEKGSLVHEIQFRLLSAFRDEKLTVTRETLPALFVRLDAMVDEVAQKVHDDLAPAIDRVWRDGVDTTKADLREWLRRIADDAVWRPWRFELSFGLPLSGERDPASQRDPVAIDAGVTLRGSIDLVEQSVQGAARATDYKTGRARAQPGNIVGGGRQLQPALYALVLEKMLPATVIDSSRLYYCTQVGQFQSVPTPLSQKTRDAVSDVMKALSHSFERGFFPAAPEKGECRYCDYQAICGPDEERRVARKAASSHSRQELELLQQVRNLP